VSKSSTPSTTYYYTKDIQYLLHEPLLAKFRDQKSLAKKISKALGRNEVSDASRLEKNLTPRMRLDHIIKERYPTFIDALRDLDDALSMLYLFANLPSTAEVPPKTVAKCQRLTMEFEHYLIRTHSLRKSFLSIKGIYYQATIQGQDILWLVPYKFVQRTAGDVDFRIMATFVEFYTTLLGFINYRLYTGIGLVYPPKFDVNSEELGAELGAFRLESENFQEEQVLAETNERAQAEADKMISLPTTEEEVKKDEEETTNALDQFESVDPTADSLLQPSITADVEAAAKLFESFTVFLSRETPRHPLEFILKAFGCKRVGWNSLDGEAGSYCNEGDPRITHQIVDRPEIPLPSPPSTEDEEGFDDGVDDSAAILKANERVPGRIYVQPQWVWDSINMGQLQRPDLYAPGATLPPHLSPWVKAKKGEYDPTKSLAEQETEAEAAASDEEEEDEDEEEEEEDSTDKTQQMADILEARNIAQGEGMDVKLGGESDSDSASEEDDDFGGFSEDEEPEDDATRKAREHQAELEAEALGKNVNTVNDAKEKKKAAKVAAQSKRTQAERQATEEEERRKGMMSRRKRKMYEKMVYSNAQKDAEAEKLRAKRRKLEKKV
jgi:pescadillo protein